MKWRIQREWFGPEMMFGPVYPMWFAYPPARERAPYMFSTWRQAMDWSVLRPSSVTRRLGT